MTKIPPAVVSVPSPSTDILETPPLEPSKSLNSEPGALDARTLRTVPVKLASDDNRSTTAPPIPNTEVERERVLSNDSEPARVEDPEAIRDAPTFKSPDTVAESVTLRVPEIVPPPPTDKNDEIVAAKNINSADTKIIIRLNYHNKL